MSYKHKKSQEQKMDHEEAKKPTEVREQVSIEEQLAGKDEEIRSYVDRLQHLQAEFENYKKRVLRDMAELEEKVTDREILDFITLYDNLERAFANYSDETNAVSFVTGVEKIFAQFDDLLKRKGVTPIAAQGEMFNPSKHEALLSIESSEEKNAILEEFERGYERNGRVLRPCKVKVSKGVQDTEESREES